MKKFRDRTIKIKLVMIITLTSIFTVITGLGTYLVYDLITVQEEMKKNIILNAEMVAQYAVVPLTFDYKDEATDILSKFRTNADIIDACIYKPNGELFATYHKAGETNYDFPPLQNEGIKYKKNYLHIYQNIHNEGKYYGTIYLRISTGSILKRFIMSIGVIVFLIMTLFAFVYLISFRIQRIISQPIIKLTNSIAKVSERQNFALRLQPRGNDEMGELYRQFNNMLSQLERWQTERDIREKDIAFLAHVLRNITENVSITDDKGTILFVNNSLLENYGYTKEELVGQNINIIRSLDHSSIISDMILTYPKEGWHGEIAGKRKDGSEFPLSLTSTIIFDKDNEPMAIAWVGIDITKQKEVQEELKKSENYFRNIFETSTNGISITQINGKMKVNPAFAKMLGYRQDEMENVNWQDITLKEDIQQNELNISQIIEGYVNSIRWEKRYIHKDGHIVWTDVSTALQRDSENKPQYFITSVLDITDRKEAERKLTESEHKLRDAQEMAHLGFWSWEIQTGAVEWSEEVFKIFELNSSSFKPQIDSILSLSPWPEENRRDVDLIESVKRDRSPSSYEQKFIKPNNRIGYYYSTFQGIFNEKDELVRIVGTILDITERKIAEIALRESEEKFKKILVSTPLPIVYSDKEGTILFRNERFVKVFGYSEEEIPSINEWWINAYPDETYRNTVMNEWYETVNQAKKNQTEILSDTYQVTCKDGSVREIYVSGIFMNQNMLVTFIDITERNRSESQIQMQLDELRRWYNVMLDREERIMELKKEVNELLIKSKKPIRYIATGDENINEKTPHLQRDSNVDEDLTQLDRKN